MGAFHGQLKCQCCAPLVCFRVNALRVSGSDLWTAAWLNAPGQQGRRLADDMAMQDQFTTVECENLELSDDGQSAYMMDLQTSGITYKLNNDASVSWLETFTGFIPQCCTEGGGLFSSSEVVIGGQGSRILVVYDIATGLFLGAALPAFPDNNLAANSIKWDSTGYYYCGVRLSGTQKTTVMKITGQVAGVATVAWIKALHASNNNQASLELALGTSALFVVANHYTGSALFALDKTTGGTLASVDPGYVAAVDDPTSVACFGDSVILGGRRISIGGGLFASVWRYDFTGSSFTLVWACDPGAHVVSVTTDGSNVWAALQCTGTTGSIAKAGFIDGVIERRV